MKVSRRNFVASCAAATAVATIAPTGAQGLTHEPSTRQTGLSKRFPMSENLTKSVFEKHLNSEFQVQNGSGGTIAAELIEVSEGRCTPKQEQWAILFRAPKETPLQQSMYQFKHSEMGKFELFIVPVGEDEGGYQYEAVFNHLL